MFVGDLPTEQVARVFDDGAVYWYDREGNVSYAQDASGAAMQSFGAAGSGIVQQFVSLFDYGVRAAIENKFPKSPTVQRKGAAPALGESNLNGLLILGAIAFFAVKLLAK